MAPEGGLFAEAVGIELSNLGYTIIDSSFTSKLMVPLNIDDVEIATPQGLEKFKSKGIDAFLMVKGAGAYDSQIQSASARKSSAHTGRIIAGVSWKNGWGGVEQVLLQIAQCGKAWLSPRKKLLKHWQHHCL